ncbi:MAG TPA: RidA family protein [Gammaproteobacteria bacterium]|nr:RidA family protein [Gammaproteobacteria bacterium]
MSKNVELISPKGLYQNPAFSQVAVVSGDITTIYIGGQNAVSPSGEIVGKSDIATQAKQTLNNVQEALKVAGANLSDVIKWTVYIVSGQLPQPAFQIFQEALGGQSKPPLVTVLFVAGLANPEFLLEVEAIAITKDQ